MKTLIKMAAFVLSLAFSHNNTLANDRIQNLITTGAHSFPLTENFESGFTYFNNASGSSVNFADATNYHHGGSHCVRNAYGNSNTNILEETGVLDLSSTTSPVLEFWHIAKTEDNYDKCYIEISTNGGSSYTVLPSSTYQGPSGQYTSSNQYFDEGSYSGWGGSISNSSWKMETFDLSSYKTTNVRIRFRLTSDGSVTREGWYIDDIRIYNQCPAPTAQSESSITTTSATLTWTASGSHWDVYVTSAGGAAPSQGTTPTANDLTTKSYSWSGGSAGTSYDWYVRNDCDQNNTGTSSWTGPHSFTTQAGAHSFPLTEDFESGFSYFNNAGGNGTNFTDETTFHHGGSHCVKNAYGNNNTNILVETGVLDLSSTTNPVLEFWHIAKTEKDYDKCYVEISTNGGSSYSALPNSAYQGTSGQYTSSKTYFDEFSYSGWGGSVSNSSWKMETFDLSSYKTTNVRFRFRLASNGSATKDGWYIDDIRVYNQCPAPSAQSESSITMTSATLTWTDGSGSHWDVYVTSAGGSAPSQGTTPTANDLSTKSYSWTAGSPGTSYDWYVRSDCDQNNTGTSSWVGAHQFTTADGKATNPTPANNSTGIAISAKTLDWDDVTNATGYHISVGTTSGGTQIVNNASTSSSTYTVTSNWSTNTKYYWTVKTDYSGGTITGDEWTFTSQVGAHSFPLTEDFESGFSYFDNASGNNVNFADETSYHHGGSHCVKNAYGNSNTNILVETGILDLSSATAPVLEFWHIAKTENNYDKCYVEISTNSGSSYVVLPNSTYQGSATDYSSQTSFDEGSYSAWNGSISNSSWKKETFDLSSYKTANVRVRFKLTSDGGAVRDGWFIDDIHIYNQCPTPSAQTESAITLNGATLAWTDGSGSHWDVFVTTSGGAAPSQSTTPTANDLTTKSYTWTGGTASTAYQWYVRSDCGQDNINTSSWIGPHSFTTASGKSTNPTPSNSATGISVGSKTLNWDDVTNASGYHITVGTSSGGTQVVNNASTSSSSYTVSSSWNYSTTYYWKVTTDYSGGSVTGDEWTFTTECGSQSVPYTQDFTNWSPNCWDTDHNSTGSTFDWTQYSSGSVNCAQADRLATMVSPTINVSSLSTPSLDFDWSRQEETYNSGFSLTVEVSDDAGNTWHQVWKKASPYFESNDGASSSAPGSFINSGDINLSSYGNSLIIRFKTGSNSGNNVFIDNFRIREMPACPAPTDLSSSNIAQTTAQLNWTEVGSATIWKIEYGPAGFTPGSGTVVSNITSKPYTLTGLSAMTSYDWYVRADCGGGSTSALSSKASFDTEHYTVSTNGKTCRCSPNYVRVGGSGSCYFYDKYSFTVPTSSTYNIKATFGAHGGYTGYLYLYQTSFDPKHPSTNLIASDGSAYSNTAQIAKALTAGITYIVVGNPYNHDNTGGNIYFTIEGAYQATANSTTDYNGVPTAITHQPNLTDGTTRQASYQCVDQSGWTHYYYDDGSANEFWDDEVILSVKKNSNSIGDVGDQGFSVKLAGSPGVSHITNPPASYVSSWGGWYVFNRYWVLTPTNQPQSDVSVRFYYNSEDYNRLVTAINNSGGTPPNGHANMSCFKINNVSGNYDPNPVNGHSGVPLAQAYSADGCWVYSNGSTASTTHWKYESLGNDYHSMEYVIRHFSGGGGGASQHTGSGDGTPTPIDLLSFDVKSAEDGNLVFWKTATEENVNYFEIERMNPADSSIIPIGKTTATGNSNVIQRYSLLDDKPLEAAYYRLKEVDFDGKTTLFDWYFIRQQKNGTQLLGLYPNPAETHINLELFSFSADNAEIQIRDVSGRLVLMQKAPVNKNNETVSIDVSNLNSGTYNLTIITRGGIINRLFIKR